MLEIKNCPACGSSVFEPFISCKDYTVSGEKFSIVSCKNCNLKFTNPRPEDSKLEEYYKSEDYISHSNTRKGLIAKLYHAVRNYTLKGKLRLVSKYVSRGTVLDYGCGTGMFLKVCKDNGWEVFGMEPDQGARSVAANNGLVVDGDKQSLQAKIKNRQLDVITLWHVLEHVTDLDLTFTFFNLKLKEDGRLIIAVPNYTSYDARYYREFWAAYDVPRHLYHFEVNTLSKLLTKFGFTLEECLPMKFDSYYVSMLSEKYKTGSINYFKAFVSGFRSNAKAKTPTEYSSVIYVFKRA